MNTQRPPKPVILVLDPTPTFPRILRAILRRNGYDAEVIAFQQPGVAIFWLSGKMDARKAAKYPLPLPPWDRYPPRKPLTLAIVSLAFPAPSRTRVMTLLRLTDPRPHLFTTSTNEELAASERRDSWRHVVSHIPRPLTETDVIERLRQFLS